MNPARRLIKLLLLPALLPSVVLAALWLRSYFVGDVIVRDTRRIIHENGQATDIWAKHATQVVPLLRASPGDLLETRRHVLIARGRVLIQWARAFCPRDRLFETGRIPLVSYSFSPKGEPSYWRQVLNPAPPYIQGKRPSPWYGFDYRADRSSEPTIERSQTALIIPIWAPFVLSLAPWLYVFRAARHRHRLRAGRCPYCNYDLRATKDRCPECGHPIPANGPAAPSPNTAKPAAPK